MPGIGSSGPAPSQWGPRARAPLQRGAGAALLASLLALSLALTATSLSLWPRVSHTLRKELLSGLWPRGLLASEPSPPQGWVGPALLPPTPSLYPSVISLAHGLEGLALCPALCWAVWEVLTPDHTDLSTKGNQAAAGRSVWS